MRMKKINKLLAVIFMLLGILGLFFIFYHIICFEKYATNNISQYYPHHTSNNRDGWNCLTYFTFMSNILADIYLIILGLG